MRRSRARLGYTADGGDFSGPDPRRALEPVAIRAARTGRTHDRTRPMLYQRKEALVNRAPSTHDPKWTARERTKPALLSGRNSARC